MFLYLSIRKTNAEWSVFLPPRYVADVARRMKKKQFIFLSFCLKKQTQKNTSFFRQDKQGVCKRNNLSFCHSV